MSDPNAYVMLITGLPRPEALFQAKRPPLSRLKLQRRLRVLTTEDAAVLKRIQQAITWDNMPITLTDEQIVARVRATVEVIENETLRLIIRDRLEIRTCMVALRRRHRGEPALPPSKVWGYGRWLRHIARNWNETTFRLDNVFPWLREADRLLKAGETLAVQRLVLDQAWKNLNRHAAEHEFDFEAVVIYVLKWDIVDRWVRRDGEAAAKRLVEMTDAGLGDYASMFKKQQP